MTLYKHLGPISFQTQTQIFQIFSTIDGTLILQFKNYQQVNIDQINQILSVYQLILKEDKLLQIYTQKNKPSSILLHKAVRVGFQKINIQLLCRIIKQTILSIFHTKKVISGKSGQINKQMFYQIDGQLRYLYFPIKQKDNKSQNLIQDLLQFYDQLKDQKQLSHRLLLKKISKCESLEEILQETEYFQTIYHARQSNQFLANHNNVILNPNQSMTQQTFLSKTFNKSKIHMKNNSNQIFVNQFRHSTPFSQNGTDTPTSRNTNRRKYNLFKTGQSKLLKNVINSQNNNFSSSTWRQSKMQSPFQNTFQSNTFRSNSKAVHMDSNKKLGKHQSSSLFNRASSVHQSPKKLSSSKRKGLGFSLHQHDNLTSNNESIIKMKNRQSIKRRQLQNQQSSKLNQSILSKNLNQSQYISKQQPSYNQLKTSQQSKQSKHMKQMLNNTLQKWRKKQNQKVNIFSKIKYKDRDGSTQVDSRSKFVQKYQKSYERPSIQLFRQSNNMCRQSNVSSIHHNQYGYKNQCSKNMHNSTQSYNQTFSQGINHSHTPPIASQKKLKKGNINNNRSALVDKGKLQKQQSHQMIQRCSQQFELIQNTKVYNSKVQYKQNIPYSSLPQQQSLQQIDLCKSSIQHLAMKNKEQQMRKQQEELRLSNMKKSMERKKTSIKQIIQIKNIQRNISDQSQTERIQYSRCSKKNIKIQKQQYKVNEFNKKETVNKKQQHIKKQQLNAKQSIFFNEIKQFTNKLNNIYIQKSQIDYIGVAVVQTTQHLKSFQSIFWQLPMFFLYKKFYQKRLKLCQQINTLLAEIALNITSINKSKQTTKQIKQRAIAQLRQIQEKSQKYIKELQQQNTNIEQSLKKLLKTVKKKIKKQYPQKTQQQYIDKQLHLDYTKSYEHIIQQFSHIYLQSLIQAKPEFPELVYHIVQILQAYLVVKGKVINTSDKQHIIRYSDKKQKLSKTQTYYNSLLNTKQIKYLFNKDNQKTKTNKK